ncbi:amino acid ABC transporter permease [Variovorax sp. J22G73]|jgi:glutamate/aspartate transport system permease protein|uniref:amino acid ABC transporter permease n=1 Tax=unclassified Variovorax TaxID=663243 RepID=UPI002578FA1B|nr:MULTISPECIES: amino acid ABC transporter permease [unclassified Variovorax]MDM0005409.1 amino acid ABC transporter permease [Variovorax sp. J22R203]MDM0098825.1 amino acid ABC transporter permease [Variovorax sp. J22G73]
MFSSFDFASVWHALPYMLTTGLAFTVKLTLVAGFSGLLLGCGIAMARLSGNRVLRAAGDAYVNLFRAIPLVLGLFAFYVLVPYTAAWAAGSPTPVAVGATASAYLTFVLFESAYFCEVIRAGIRSIPNGQAAAAQALGMNGTRTMLYIVLPQALRKMLPVLLTQFIVLFQDTSLVYVLSLDDLFGTASKIAQRDGRLVEMYLFIALFYFCVSFALSSYVRALQARIARAG